MPVLDAMADPACCFEAHTTLYLDKILDLGVRINNRLQDLKTRIQYLDYEVQQLKMAQRKRKAEETDFDVAKGGEVQPAQKFFREQPECGRVNAEDFPLVKTPENQNRGVASSPILAPTIPLGSPWTNGEESEGF